MSRLPSSPSEIKRNAFASTNVTTSAYVQMIASTVAETIAIAVAETSGQSFILAIGPSGGEVDTMEVPANCDFIRPLHIGKGTRLSLKSNNSTASTGEIIITLFM